MERVHFLDSGKTSFSPFKMQRFELCSMRNHPVTSYFMVSSCLILIKSLINGVAVQLPLQLIWQGRTPTGIIKK